MGPCVLVRGRAVLGAVALGLRDVGLVRVVRGGRWGGGPNREPDVELGGRDLEQRAEEHPGSVPQPGGPGLEVGLLRRQSESVAYLSEATVRGLVQVTEPALFFLVWRDPNERVHQRLTTLLQEARCLRIFVGQLRKKLEKDPTRSRVILTDPGVDYRLVTEHDS